MKSKHKYIGTKDFYKMVLAIAVPIMVQNGISNFVSLLDNLMIGRVGTNALSGVAIANQLMFVYYLIVFGTEAGIGIFTAQYYGQKNTEGIRYSFRFKVIATLLVSLACIFIYYFNKETLISLFLKGEGSASDATETLSIGVNYMVITLAGMLPNALTNSYAGTLRETGETKIPMFASFAAVFVNLIGNYLLIYGHLGLPKMGASGAALATVISRFVEMGILIIYTATHSNIHSWIIGAFKSLYVPGHLMSKFMIKALPLMLNETLWASGQTIMNQSYSYRSLNAVAAINIESTLWNLMGVAFLAMGDAVGILVGHTLGSGDIDKARDEARKLLAFTTFCGAVFAVFMVALSPVFPELYNTSSEIKHIATLLIIVNGVIMPLYAFTHASYFIIRAGGRTGITFLFDSCFVWFVSVPAAFIISRFTLIPIVPMMAIVQSLEIFKDIVGGIMVHKGIWARNLVKEDA